MTFKRLFITMLQIHNYEKTSTTTYTQGSIRHSSIRHIVDINNEPVSKDKNNC